VALLSAPVAAQVTTDRGASILIFPKVLAEASADTVVQVANLSDNRVNALCTYVAGNDGSWESLAFSLALVPRRPVYWSAARGRSDGSGDLAVDIPPAPPGFRGELLCVQVDAIGLPFGGNELAGLATLTDLASGDVTAYNALGLHSPGFNDGDGFLCIGDGQSDTCFISEYDACPAEWILTVPADGAAEAQLSPDPRLSTRLTVVPCSQNLLDGTPSTVDIDITVYNELAERFTGMTSVTCWAELALADIAEQILTREMLGTDFAAAILRPAEGSGGSTRSVGDALVVSGAAAINLHSRGRAGAADVIALPGSTP
jgi:hypothetical protein